MTSEAFKRHTSLIINLQTTIMGSSTDKPTSAMDILNCIRHWKHKTQIPIRGLFVLDGGSVIDCRIKDELGLWKAAKMRGLDTRLIRQLAPAELLKDILG